jgi:tRNA-splicing ligase RtcB (3'-phosphate/5'-hydroxy nucleic acid ligase)
MRGHDGTNFPKRKTPGKRHNRTSKFVKEMTQNKINGAKLLALGFEEGRIIGHIVSALNKQLSPLPEEEILQTLESLLVNPKVFIEDALYGEIATVMMAEQQHKEAYKIIDLNENAPAYSIYGADHIQEGAIRQMEVAMKLPVTVAGALMPDAHQGYGLPIGGVLATRNAVIPYGVGVDIGCRMALSIFDIPEEHFLQHQSQYKRELLAWTKFGAGNAWHGREKADHAVLSHDSFGINNFTRQLQEKASVQLGTSGGGNHFVEWGIIEFEENDIPLNMDKGRYVALLSHSGSRGMGGMLAGYYTKLAKSLCKLPGEAANLAYFLLDSAEGQEYWLAMNLAGEYASACHEVIHQRLTKAMGAQVLAKVENHHNFAWKEMWNGEEVIVHRKGATPAAKGVMGIIPGSMTAPGYLVRGKGEANSIQSASHGAGRQMSRTVAEKNITNDQMRAVLQEHGVTLIGAGLDEAPMAYKDIEIVMAAQQELVDVVARFTPKMVRMAEDGSRED